MTPEEAVQEYQCAGCAGGPFPVCYETNDGEGCSKHCAGTTISAIGRIFLGMPKGFNRLGFCGKTTISIFESIDAGWGYDLFNVPVWKYLDSNGNTIVRGISPRINLPWIHIFIGDHIEKVDCYEITEKDLAEMD